jgi:hypothetical protein
LYRASPYKEQAQNGMETTLKSQQAGKQQANMPSDMNGHAAYT